MAIDEADQSESGHFSDDEASSPESDGRQSPKPTRGSDVRVGAYTWAEFMDEYGYGNEVSDLYPYGSDGPNDQLGLDTNTEARSETPRGDDWDRVSFDPARYLGYDPDGLSALITDTFAPNAKYLDGIFLDYVDPETTPVTKDIYTWEHYKWEYYYDEDGTRPRDSNGEIERFDGEEALGFDPDEIRAKLFQAGNISMELDDVVDERTVNVQEDFDEDEFFSTENGHTTVANRYDLEKAVPIEKKTHFRERERYWVNKPYAFVIIFHSERENETKYYMIEPNLNEIERELQEFLSGKLRTAIKYSDEGIKQKESEDGRRDVIEKETRQLLKRYDLFEKTSTATDVGIVESLRAVLSDEPETEAEEPTGLEGLEVRPEPVLLEEDSDTLSEYQVEKLLHYLKRNFIGYERIDGIKHDINVEDISVDGYNSPVFVYHSEYEQIISNIHHGEDELDDFVVKLAQRSGKGISKRLPQVDATLPDGSRAQLTLGKEVSDHGTNYTIRQFKDVPFTPIDLINWNTFSLEEMAFLWLAIENHKSLIFAGGTASGKTTSLNAVSLFIPSSTKIVSIEDTREVELPQRNWIASVTRPSFSDDSQGDVDEFDLLEAALRQRPDYIVMGEIRGEEGRTLFQVMSTGHTTYTTFHADSVDEVLKRFTTDPINVSKTMFTALNLVSIQTQTRVQGRKVRRNKSLTEINHYEAEHDEINVQDVYQWQAETDEYLKMGDSNTIEAIQFDRGWDYEKLQSELFKREVILAYLIKNGLNTYAQVAATVQAFINDPETILTLIANDQLESSLEDLREMESVLIDVDPEKEALVPRPDATSETYNLSMDLLERAEESLFEEFRGQVPSGLASALGDIEEPDPIEVDRASVDEFDFGGEIDEEFSDGDWELGDGTTEFTFDGDDETTPSWLEDDGGFELGDESEPEPTAGTPTQTATDEINSPDESTTPTASDAKEPTPELPQLDAAADWIGETESEDESKESGERIVDGDPGTEADRDNDQTADRDDGSVDDRGDGDGELAEPAQSRNAPSSPRSDVNDATAATDGVDGVEPESVDGTGDANDSAAGEPTLEDGDDPDEGNGDDAEPAADGSDFEAMFPDRELDSVFGTEPSDSGSSSGIDLTPEHGASDGESESNESIFGGESRSIFGDGETSTGGNESIFTDDGSPTMTDAEDADGSIFGGAETESTVDDDGSVFGGEQRDEDDDGSGDDGDEGDEEDDR